MALDPMDPTLCPHPEGALVRESKRLLVSCRWCETQFSLTAWRDFHELPRSKDINLKPYAGQVTWIRSANGTAYGYAHEEIACPR